MQKKNTNKNAMPISAHTRTAASLCQTEHTFLMVFCASPWCILQHRAGGSYVQQYLPPHLTKKCLLMLLRHEVQKAHVHRRNRHCMPLVFWAAGHCYSATATAAGFPLDHCLNSFSCRSSAAGCRAVHVWCCNIQLPYGFCTVDARCRARMHRSF